MLLALRPGVRVLLRRNGLCNQRLCVHNFPVLENKEHFQGDIKESPRRRRPQLIPAEQLSLHVNANIAPPQQNQSEADTFGTLSSATEVPLELLEGDEADKEEGTEYSKEIKEREKKWVDYAHLITELLAEKKFLMALEVMETQMKTDKVKPDRYIYLQLIAFCGKVGYPQKAFKLYTTMKKRRLAITGDVYTSLFNACANCPDQKIGLKYAEHLRDIMRTKGFNPNIKTYNAMIKAYGRCGDLNTAFSLADEIMSKKIKLEVGTMSFLLQSCISNKEKGFLYALLVWGKMRQYRILPNIFSYNLLLRCVRDTGMGDLKATREVFEKLLPEEKLLLTAETTDENTHLSVNEEVYPWDMASADIISGNTSSEPKLESSNSLSVVAARPDLLAEKPTLGGLVIVDQIKTPSDRLMLLGGLKGLTQSMINDGTTPTIKTFTLLLDCIPSTITAEKGLLQEMESKGVQPDTGFFNALIYRRSKRGDYESGLAVLDLMKQYGLEMDVITVQSLAYCCTTKDMFVRFMEDLKDAGFNLTPPLLGAILRNAIHSIKFGFIHFVMDVYQHEEVPVHKGSLEALNEFYTKNHRILKGKDKPPQHMEKLYNSDYFKTGTKLFFCKLSDWKKRIQIDESSEKEYWEQFAKSGKEIKELEPYMQKWRKGSRYAKAEWRKKKAAYVAAQLERK